ncbi:MAG: virulence RhuM family protein [Bacteroidales bacterium]|nr:virulence RhuM family protein [Bacteroidales bacterium]
MLIGEITARELIEDSVIQKFSIVRQVGRHMVSRGIEHYNLDTIISGGYRVNSKRGAQFRQWATQRLKDFLVKGYTINEKRLYEKQQEVLHLK